jgi:hypothetical protein
MHIAPDKIVWTMNIDVRTSCEENVQAELKWSHILPIDLPGKHYRRRPRGVGFFLLAKDSGRTGTFLLLLPISSGDGDLPELEPRAITTRQLIETDIAACTCHVD